MAIVCKFGGTSMATAASIKKVAKILRADDTRTVCVVSAPGKTLEQTKVTDLLQSGDIQLVYTRFQDIITSLGLGADVHDYLDQQYVVRAQSMHLPTRLSFGEHMSAYILATLLHWRFVDAAEVIHFSSVGVTVHTPWYKGEKVVVPGFYGYNVQGNHIDTFMRGGSDITGAYVAAFTQARAYENWTDVAGVYTADPHKVRNARPYTYLTYDELVTITKNGAAVFHPEAITPIAHSGIPTIIKNTFAPRLAGTIILRPSL